MIHSENTESPSQSLVAATHCPKYQSDLIVSSLVRHFELQGGIDRFINKGDRILVKPNFIAPKPPDKAVQTHPAVILELVKLLCDYGAKPFIADSPAWADTDACIRILGLTDPLKKLGVSWKQLNHPQRLKIAGSCVGISKVALEADKIINLPKLKAHQQLGVTIAVKNMFGCVSGKEKAYWHFARGKSDVAFCRMLIEIYRKLAPVLTIIDAVQALEGPGPLRGTPRELGWLVSGTDPIACELFCCELIQLDPWTLPIIRTARLMKYGCTEMESISVVGDPWQEKRCRDFEIPTQIPIRFSLLRICRSALRQGLMLMRQVVTGSNSRSTP